jgi:hypothetical protein
MCPIWAFLISSSTHFFCPQTFLGDFPVSNAADLAFAVLMLQSAAGLTADVLLAYRLLEPLLHCPLIPHELLAAALTDTLCVFDALVWWPFLQNFPGPCDLAASIAARLVAREV